MILMASRRLLLRLLTAALATVLALIAAEAALRLVPERSPGEGGAVLDYGDTWRAGGLGPGGYLKEDLDVAVADGYGGTVRWRTNSLGLRNERETAPEPPPGTLRVLSLGDSFTAGYRVDQHETFSYLLQEHLREEGRFEDAEVLIAVTEEPVTGLDYLAHRGLALRPHVVLLGLTLGNDIAQAWVNLHPWGPYTLTWEEGGATIGGNPAARPEELRRRAEELRIPERCLRPGAAPAAERTAWLDTLAGRWRLARLLAGRLRARREAEGPQAVVSTWGEFAQPRLLDSNGLGVLLRDPPVQIGEAYERLSRTLAAYQELCRRHGAELLVALFPQRYQVQPQDWPATVAAYGLDPECFALERPNREIGDFCRRRGVSLLDPTAALAQAHRRLGRSLYLPRGDMHWNALGHRVFFEALRPAFEKLTRTTNSTPPRELRSAAPAIPGGR